MALTKGNYSGNNMPQGMTDEQNRELQRGLILLPHRSRKPLASDMGMKAASSRPSCII